MGARGPNNRRLLRTPRTRPWGRGTAPGPNERGTYPARRPTVHAQRPLPVCRGGGRSARTNPHFFSLRLLSRAGEKASGAKKRGRVRSDPEGAGGVRGSARRGGHPQHPAARTPAPARTRLPAGVAPKTRTTGTFLTGSWVRGDWQISSPRSGLAM